jgi:hypothetical protein
VDSSLWGQAKLVSYDSLLVAIFNLIPIRPHDGNGLVFASGAIE